MPPKSMKRMMAMRPKGAMSRHMAKETNTADKRMAAMEKIARKRRRAGY